MTTLFERGGVIDVDTHLTEPPDVWTARMASKWGDAIPHVERIAGEDVWMSAGERGIGEARRIRHVEYRRGGRDSRRAPWRVSTRR